MKSPKPLVAGALFAGTLLLGGGIAAAVTLPDDSSDTAKEQVTTVDHDEADEAQAEADDTEAEDEATDETEAEDETDEADEAEKSADTESDDEAGEDEAGERPTDNHGYEVSTFAHETELEGRAKGEAISALARSNSSGKGGGHEAGDDTEDEAKPATAGRSAEAGAKAQGHAKK